MFKKNKNPNPNIRQQAAGRSKSPVYSYYATRSSEGSTSVKKTAKNFNWQLIPSILAAVVIIASLIYAAGLNTNPRVKVEATKNDALLQEESVYAAAAEAYLKSSILNRSKLLINTKSIEDRMRQQFPELKTVGLTIPLTSRRPIITVKAVQPRLMLVTTGGNYIIDNSGRAVLKVNDSALADGLDLPKIQDETGLEIQLGKVALTARETAFIAEVGHQLSAKAIVITSFVLPTVANELNVRPEGQPYFVKLNMLGDARQQVGAFVSTKEKLEADGIKPAEYIDVRVEEKAYYK